MINEEPTIENFEETKSVPPFKTAAKWGAIIGGTAIVYALIKQIAIDNYIIGVPVEFILILLLLGFGIVFSQLDHKKTDLNGTMSYGRAMGIGVLSGLIGLILYSIIDALFFAYILDEVTITEAFNYTLEKSLEVFESRGIDFSDKQLSQMEKGMEEGFTPGGRFKSNLLTYGFISIIITLISSIFTRSKN